jgi:hypothetical protein
MNQTISAFAEARGHDRRTVKRRLMAKGIAPVRVEGRVRFYDVTAMESIMENPVDPSGLLSMHRDDQKLIYALEYLGEFFPDSMTRALKDCNLSKEQIEIATVRLWACQAQTVVNAMPAAVGGVPIIVPEWIQMLAEKHNLNLENLGSLIS